MQALSKYVLSCNQRILITRPQKYECFLYACRLKSKFISTILTVMQEGHKFVKEKASQGLKTKFITGYICYIVDQLL